MSPDDHADLLPACLEHQENRVPGNKTKFVNRLLLIAWQLIQNRTDPSPMHQGIPNNLQHIKNLVRTTRVHALNYLFNGFTRKFPVRGMCPALFAK
jgi:hypothetical protein